MRSWFRFLLMTLLSVILIAGIQPVATAEARSSSDPRGDHWGSDRFDIRRLTVNHGDQRVKFKVRMWNMPRHRHIAFNAYIRGGGRDPWYRNVTMILHSDGRSEGRVYRDGPAPDPYDHVVVPRCPVRTNWLGAKRTAIFSAPRRCLPRGSAIGVDMRAASIAWSQDPQDVVGLTAVRRG